MRSAIAVIISVLVFAMPARCSDVLPKELVKNLGSDDLKLRYAAQQELWGMAARAGRPGAEVAVVRELEEALLALAGDSGAPEAARLAALRPFNSIGAAPAVAALAHLLGDPAPAVREAARVALEMNPAPEASQPLRDALRSSTDSRWTMGLAEALMHRRDVASLPLFRGLLGHEDKDVVRLAAQALGVLGGEEAVAALRDALPRLEGRQRTVAQSALIRAGATPEVVEGLWPEASNAAVRCEIFSALLKADKAAAARIVVAVVSNPDLAGAAQILREAVRSGIAAVVDPVLEAEPRLPVEARLAVLGALADQQDTRSAGSLVALLETADPRHRPALIAMLGGSGTGAQVPLLLGLTEDRSPEVASAAAVALSRLRLEGVDESLLARARDGSEEARLAAIRLAAYRNPAGTEEALGQLLAEDPSTAVRESALGSLGVVGGVGTANLLLARIASAEDAAAARPFQAEFRRMAPRLLSVPVLWREGFLPAYEAAKTPQSRAALIMMLAGLRGPEAGSFLVRTVQGAEGPERNEALKQLTGWTHTAAGPFLLELAKTPDLDTTIRDAAFDSLARLFFPTVGGGKGAKQELAPKVLAAAPDEAIRRKIQQAIDDSKVLMKTDD